jgi:hypothetical protein
VIELFAITAHPAPPLPDVAPLCELSRDGLSAVFAETVENGAATAERLWHHEHVVETLMESRDLLPVRYGTSAPDEAALARALDRRHDELATALSFVRGAVELSVRVFGDPTDRDGVPPRRSRSGSEYLRARARDAAVQHGIAQSVHEPLRAIARADHMRRPQDDLEVLRSAYLVDRGRVGRFTRAVAELESDLSGFRLLCTGPWPPYSFVER